MKIIRYPERGEWKKIVERPHLDVSQLNAIVKSVLDDIRVNGDKAVMAYEEKFDHVKLSSLAVGEAEIHDKALVDTLCDQIYLFDNQTLKEKDT